MCAYVFLSFLDVLCELCVSVVVCARSQGRGSLHLEPSMLAKTFLKQNSCVMKLLFFFHGGVWGERRESSGSAGH